MRRAAIVLALAVCGCGSVSPLQRDASGDDDGKPIDVITACAIGVTSKCDGNTLVACNGQGTITNTTNCPAGCDATNKRCSVVTPSNSLSTEYDQALTATDLVLSGQTTIDTDAHTIVDQSGARTPLTSLVSASPVNLFVIMVKSFKTGGTVTVNGTRALVILSAGDVAIDHDIDVSGKNQTNGPGAVTNDSSCSGGTAGAANSNGQSGGGGGGFGTPGGKGGVGGSPSTVAGAVGQISGSDALVPLRGGCPGGRAGSQYSGYAAGAAGGAIQITSGTKIAIGDGAAILANGTGGRRTAGGFVACFVGSPCGEGDGGGAGGGVLLEAPSITVALTGGVFANGGAGLCNVNGAAADGPRSTSPAAGDVCSGDTGSGGSGGAVGVAAQNGADGSGTYPDGGGGGGGLGRVRVNLPPGVAFSPMGSVSAAITAGTLQTH